MALPMSLGWPKGDFVSKSYGPLKLAGCRPSKLQRAITFTYEVLQKCPRYAWKRLEIALPMSLVWAKGDFICESYGPLKLAGCRTSNLQRGITFTYGVLKIFPRYAWKRLEMALPMSPNPWKNIKIWESNCTLKLAGLRPSMIQSAITFSNFKPTKI